MPPASSRAGVLSPDTNAPPVTQTAVSPNLLKPLNIISQLGIEILSKDLGVLSCLEILLTVEEPKRDLELTGVLDNGDEFLDFIGCKLSGALVDINFGLFADEVGETASETLDFCKTKHNVTFSFNVGVENTENVLELRSLHQ